MAEESGYCPVCGQYVLSFRAHDTCERNAINRAVRQEEIEQGYSYHPMHRRMRQEQYEKLIHEDKMRDRYRR